MLDVKSKLILKNLIKECPSGRFKIVDAKDVICALPMRYKVDADELDDIFSFLERQELISIKYDDGGLYCLCVLPLGYEIGEKSEQQKREVKSSQFLVFTLLNCIVSIVSGILGVIIANILLLG